MCSSIAPVGTQPPAQVSFSGEQRYKRSVGNYLGNLAFFGTGAALFSGAFETFSHKLRMKDPAVLDELERSIDIYSANSADKKAKSAKYILECYNKAKIPWKNVGKNALLWAGISVAFSLLLDGIGSAYHSLKN